MTCERCKDIHKAQVEGRTQRECGCSCHSHYTTQTGTGTWTSSISTGSNDINSITYTSTDSGGAFCDVTGNDQV